MWWIGFLLFPFNVGLLASAELKTEPAANIKWVVDKSSVLRVKGQSNINHFTCDIAAYDGSDTLYIVSNGSGGSVKLNGSLQVAVSQFNCHNKLITNDLRKTLKAKEFPFIKVRFLSLERAPKLNSVCEEIKGWVEVELAGEKKVMQIPFEFGSNGSTVTTMNGEKIFCFTDFKLSPPAKMAGSIKIKDEFNVHFQLRLRMI